MPKIKTSTGVIEYKTIPLYLGVKLIDKDKALDNLILVKKILDENNVPFQLAYGTLLGAVREKGFIDHDEDIDLNILEEDKQKFIDTLPLLMREGFKVARYDRRGLMSIIRNGEYIDFYFFSSYNEELRICSGMICPRIFLEQISPMMFYGSDYMAPTDFEGFLRFEYGNNWMTPVQWNCYVMPWYKKLMFATKEHLKDLLPDFIYFKLSKSAEQKLFNQYSAKLNRYKQNDLNNGTN